MNLDIIPNGAIKRVHLSQNDIGRTLTFNLFNDSLAYTVPIGATVKIQGTKPSGFGFSETCTVSGNTVTIDTTEAMTDEFGYIEAELQITNSGDVIGTSNFILAIEKNPHPDNTTDGTQITAQSLEVRIEALEESALGGLTDGAKQALLNCFAHVAWIDDDGQDYYDALENALYPPANLVSISCVYTQSGTVYDTDSLDSLKSDLVVTAHFDDSSTRTVTSYTLSGTLTEGTSTITVSYGGKTTTFNVTVTHQEVILYPLPEMQSETVSGFSMTVADGVVTAQSTQNSKSVFIKADGTLADVNPPVTTWFPLNNGDTYTFRVKNISFSGNTNNSNRWAFGYKDDNAVTKISSGDMSLTSSSGTLADVEVTGTISEDVTNVIPFIYIYRAVTLTFTIELYINDTRYM